RSLTDVPAINPRASARHPPPFQGTADQVAADIRRYQALGVSHFVFDHTVQEVRAVIANMERFASDVRPRVTGGRKAAASSAGGRSSASKPKAARRRA